ncbi:hypothetical protein JCM8208_001130 [Rhodotorula glutinis]
MYAVEACTIPTHALSRDKFLNPSQHSLTLVLKHILHTKRLDNGEYVLTNRSAFAQWRARQEMELREAWCAPSAHRELFAKAMVWWDRRLQRGDLRVDQMPPPSVLKGWLAGEASLEQYWDPVAKRWGTTVSYDPARAHSLSKAPRAQLGLRAAHIYGLDGQDWEERNAARRF